LTANNTNFSFSCILDLILVAVILLVLSGIVESIQSTYILIPKFSKNILACSTLFLSLCECDKKTLVVDVVFEKVLDSFTKPLSPLV